MLLLSIRRAAGGAMLLVGASWPAVLSASPLSWEYLGDAHCCPSAGGESCGLCSCPELGSSTWRHSPRLPDTPQGFSPASFPPGWALPPQGLKAETRGGLGFAMEVLCWQLLAILSAQQQGCCWEHVEAQVSKKIGMGWGEVIEIGPCGWVSM